jgi:glycosyltransferase involved in cell wall biosynthesis
MTLQNEPLVSVVTPIYNGESYLAECIESVFAQSYQNWEYILVNNCSTDGTLAVAERYARGEPRMRVVTHAATLPMIVNWNSALHQISPQSQFCKVLHADDWLFPECLTRMVEVALPYPNIGIVSAYRLNEDRVDLDGLPYGDTILDGYTVGRLSLGDEPLYLFGSPTSTLLRADLVRGPQPFYNEAYLHADTDACFRTLLTNDFGFVHQVLTYTRRHNESVTSKVKRLETIQAERLGCYLRYGPHFLEPVAFATGLEHLQQGYYVMLARHLLGGSNQEFWHYHKTNLAALGMPLAWPRLVHPLLLEVGEALLHFRHTLRGLMKRQRTLSTRQAEPQAAPHEAVAQERAVQGIRGQEMQVGQER